jgi:hypothetical protein
VTAVGSPFGAADRSTPSAASVTITARSISALAGLAAMVPRAGSTRSTMRLSRATIVARRLLLR